MGEVDGDDGLSGHVEIDEAYIGGKDSVRGRPTDKTSKKTGVLGMVQRGGNIITRVIPDVKTDTLLPHITQHVKAGSTISTDELHSYNDLSENGYEHGVVKHAAKEWKSGIHHTNTIEGFWGRLKLSIKGTHIHVSRKHMPKYLAEFEFRYNRRDDPTCLFSDLMESF
jgi:transposase-like protein